MLCLTKEPLLLDKKERKLPYTTGACLFFAGIVRNAPEDHGASGIEYSAFDKMCSLAYQLFEEQMLHKFPFISIEVVHRLGFVPVGEVSLLVTVSAAHRKDTFQALEETVEWLKESLPIWKKIIHNDGSSEWKGNHEKT